MWDTSKPTGGGTTEIPHEHRSLAGIYSCWTCLSPDTEIVTTTVAPAKKMLPEEVTAGADPRELLFGTKDEQVPFPRVGRAPAE
jgi:hypothetical protein